MDDPAELLAEVKRATAGRLPLATYRRLYDAARDIPGGAIVEIGTAQGAATIALALGARASGKPFHLYTVDPFDRGTRRGVGSVADTVASVRAGFERFGVAEDISLVVGETADLVARHAPQAVSLLLLDADGRIDRDLQLLDDALVPSAQIIVADAVDQILARPCEGDWQVDQKQRVATLLAKAFCARGLLLPEAAVGHMRFYRRGPASLPPAEMTALALDAYRQLVSGRIADGQIGWRAGARRFAERRMPGLLEFTRALRSRAR